MTRATAKNQIFLVTLCPHCIAGVGRRLLEGDRRRAPAWRRLFPVDSDGKIEDSWTLTLRLRDEEDNECSPTEPAGTPFASWPESAEKRPGPAGMFGVA